MNTASDKIISLIKKRLAADTEFVSVKSIGGRESLITAIKDGVTLTVPMDKVNFTDYMGDRIIEVGVVNGTTVTDAIKKLSRVYGLYFLEGVDYKEDPTVISFSGVDRIQYKIEIAEECVFTYGTINVTFYNEETCLKCKGLQTFDIGQVKLRLALSSKLFTTYDVLIVGGGIGRVLSADISDYLKTIPDIVPLEVGMLASVEVTEIFNDGISDIATVQLPNNDLHFIRYKFIQNELIVPEPPVMTL